MDSEKMVLLSLLLLIFRFTLCISKDTIKPNQPIKDGNLLISRENKFALGFFSPGSSSNRYLGIWYHKVPEQTVVWIANRNSPIIGSSGFLSINQYGNLILYSNHQQQLPLLVWSTDCSVGESGEAQLLDSGNLVLVQGRSRRVVWQSFDSPTNTMLQGMKLGLNRKTGQDLYLTSWRSADDPGTGDYLFKLNPGGSPQFFLYKSTNLFWRTASWAWTIQTNLFNISFLNNQDEISFVYTLHDDSVILSIVVDHSGFLKVLTWNKRNGQWKELGAVPKNGCDWYGKCGAYSTCEPADINRFVCNCLPGYEPKYPSNWFMGDGSGGCVRKRLESSSVCGHGEGFVKVAEVLLPDTSAAVWVDGSVNLADCEQHCKTDCLCTAYAIADVPGKARGCLTWFGELKDITYDRNEGCDLYVRVDALELAENARKSNGSHGNKILVIAVPFATSLCFVISIFAYLWHRKKGNGGTWMSDKLEVSSNNPDFEVFNLSTMSAATNNFSLANKLGQGGFGWVYKGLLPSGEKVAVKRLSKNSGQGIEEFRNEVTFIAKLQHRNLVKLLGCCIEEEERMLIYEYLPNKSLDSFLFDETRKLCLDWRKRFDIIVGIARGILYLHQDSRLRIIHRDLKCSNILLDSEMNPKISDFGMARLFERDQIQDKTNRVVGTFGYMSPEYAVFGKFSVKSDVFSFGVMLLEIVSGKKNNRFDPDDPYLTLIGHVWDLWREDRAMEIVDSSLKELYHPQEALKCIQIGLLCVQENAVDRPSMLAIVFMLNGNGIAIPTPKQPAFIFREPCCNLHTPIDIDEEDEEEGSCSVDEPGGLALNTLNTSGKAEC